jgi:hypothetical protein
MTTVDNWDFIELGNGHRVLRADVPKYLQREYDYAKTPMARDLVVKKIRKHVDPDAVITGKSDAMPELRKSITSEQRTATVIFAKPWSVGVQLFINGRDGGLKGGVTFKLCAGCAETARHTLVSGTDSSDLPKLQRAAIDAETRHRYGAGGPEFLADSHSHTARISNTPIDFSNLMEEIRTAYARALAADETGSIAFQQEMGRRVIGFIAQMSNPSRRANDAIILAGQRNRG